MRLAFSSSHFHNHIFSVADSVVCIDPYVGPLQTHTRSLSTRTQRVACVDILILIRWFLRPTCEIFLYIVTSSPTFGLEPPQSFHGHTGTAAVRLAYLVPQAQTPPSSAMPARASRPTTALARRAGGLSLRQTLISCAAAADLKVKALGFTTVGSQTEFKPTLSSAGALCLVGSVGQGERVKQRAGCRRLECSLVFDKRATGLRVTLPTLRRLHQRRLRRQRPRLDADRPTQSVEGVVTLARLSALKTTTASAFYFANANATQRCSLLCFL
jgi:hypothetical protein